MSAPRWAPATSYSSRSATTVRRWPRRDTTSTTSTSWRAWRTRVALLRRPDPRLDPGHLEGPADRPAAADDLSRRAPMTGTTLRLTVAQATVRFLAQQFSERDGVEQRLVPGCFGIFGHGNVAGVGQALLQAQVTGDADMPYYLARNEQGMVHAAVGFARMRNRVQAMACTASIGPGSTNMLTGAALATINRIPVLLLPSDSFATRAPAPCCRSWRTRAATTSRSTTRSGRSLGSSTGSTGPSSCPRRCSPRCGCSPTRLRPARSPSLCRRTSRPRPSTGRRPSSRSASGTSPDPCRSRRHWIARWQRSVPRGVR